MNIPAYLRKKIHDQKQDNNQEQVDQAWQVLKLAIDEIYEERASLMKFPYLYDMAFQMVTNRQGQLLYDNVRSAIQQHTTRVCEHVVHVSDQDFLHELLRIWEKLRKAASVLKDLLLYLDTNFVEKNRVKILPVYSVGIQIFKTDVLVKLTNRVQNLVMSLIQKERNSEAVLDKFLIKSLTVMMTSIDKEVYHDCFERRFLEESAEYYRVEATEYFANCTATEYLRKVQARLREEGERAERCMDPETKAKIEHVVKREMIDAYKELIITKEGSGCLVMLREERLDDLRLVYDVMGLVEGALLPAVELVKDYGTKQGLELVRDKDKEKKPLDLVEDVIKLRMKYDHLLVASFSGRNKNGDPIRDKDFSKAIKEAFDAVVNDNKRFPEYLSLLLDSKLKVGKTQLLDTEYDEFFYRVISVFRHFRDKDIFEKYYKNHLAKRLLSGRSVEDAERTFIAKLKEEFGYQFTAKIEGMFKDIKLSEDIMTRFKEHIVKVESESAELAPPIDVNVQVLTYGYWPVQSNPKCNMPEFVKNSEEFFRKFYVSNHNGRKLTWQYNMGTADIRMHGFAKAYDINVSTYQMSILLYMNEVSSGMMTYKDLEETTGIPTNELKKNLLALCVPTDRERKSASSRVLIRDPPAKDKKDIDAVTTFTVNADFKSATVKIKILPVVIVTNEEDDQNRKQVDEERSMLIDSALVRIMKSKKQLEHTGLLSTVIEQLSHRFKPSPDVIKKRVESLIEREFIERDPANRRMYRYLA